MHTITHTDYNRLKTHRYAGPGTPTNPHAPGVWWLTPGPALVYGTISNHNCPCCAPA